MVSLKTDFRGWENAMRTALATMILTLAVSTAFGQQTHEMIDKFKEHLNTQLVDKKFEQDLTTWQDNTENQFGQRIGNQIKARGWAKIDKITEIEGKLIKKHYPDDPDAGIVAFDVWKGDLKITMDWSSFTHGERWVWPGGAKVDNVWDSLHPKGKAVVTVSITPQGAVIKDWKVTVSSYAGNNDRANEFVSERLIKGRLQGEITERLKTFGIPIK
jgi:hypothetical protein